MVLVYLALAVMTFIVLPLCLFKTVTDVLHENHERLPRHLVGIGWFSRMFLITYHIPAFIAGLPAIGCYLLSLVISSAIFCPYVGNRNTQGKKQAVYAGCAVALLTCVLWGVSISMVPGAFSGFLSALDLNEVPPPSAYEGVDNGACAYAVGKALFLPVYIVGIPAGVACCIGAIIYAATTLQNLYRPREVSSGVLPQSADLNLPSS